MLTLQTVQSPVTVPTLKTYHVELFSYELDPLEDTPVPLSVRVVQSVAESEEDAADSVMNYHLGQDKDKYYIVDIVELKDGNPFDEF